MAYKEGPKLEYTYGLPRKRLYAPIEAGAEVVSKRERVAKVEALIEGPLAGKVATGEVEIKEEEIDVVSDEDGLPGTDRSSPTVSLRLTLAEIQAVDRVRGARSRNSFIRTLVQRAVKAIEAQGEVGA